MDCSEVHINLISYIEGSLDKETAGAVSGHLDKCNECSAFMDMLRGSLAVIEQEKNVPANPGFTASIMAAMHRQQKDTGTVKLSVLRYIAAAAVIVFGVFTGINIARVVTGTDDGALYDADSEAYYLNDMYHEPIESFFLLNYDDNE